MNSRRFTRSFRSRRAKRSSTAALPVALPGASQVADVRAEVISNAQFTLRRGIFARSVDEIYGVLTRFELI
jgi:hypothetical protein